MVEGQGDVVLGEEREEPSGAVERPRNRIQVSKDKKPLNFFVNLTKRLLTSEDEVELSGLGMGKC